MQGSGATVLLLLSVLEEIQTVSTEGGDSCLALCIWPDMSEFVLHTWIVSQVNAILITLLFEEGGRDREE